jgi:hypothetical protein
VAFDDRGVLVDGGDGQGALLLGVEFGHAPHHSGLNLLQGLDGVAAGEDEAFLLVAIRAQVGQFLVVEALEEGAHGGDSGEGVTQSPAQAGIVGKQAEVLGTIAGGGLEEDEEFDELGFGETASALFEGEVGLDEVGEFEGTEGTGGGEESGVDAGGFGERPGVKVEEGLVLERDARRPVGCKVKTANNCTQIVSPD